MSYWTFLKWFRLFSSDFKRAMGPGHWALGSNNEQSGGISLERVYKCLLGSGCPSWETADILRCQWYSRNLWGRNVVLAARAWHRPPKLGLQFTARWAGAPLWSLGQFRDGAAGSWGQESNWTRWSRFFQLQFYDPLFVCLLWRGHKSFHKWRTIFFWLLKRYPCK